MGFILKVFSFINEEYMVIFGIIKIFIYLYINIFEETCEFKEAYGSKDDIRKEVINYNRDETDYKFHRS